MKTVKVELKAEVNSQSKLDGFFVTVNGLIVPGTWKPTREEGFEELKKITEAMMIANRFDEVILDENYFKTIHSAEITKDVEWAKVHEAYDCALNEAPYMTGNEYYNKNA